MNLRPDEERPRITAGKLDRKITIQRATYARNDFGEQVPTWATLATVRCEAKPVSDSERVKSREVSAEISMRFTIRWNSTVSTVNPKDQIVFEGDTFDIVGVKFIGFREGLEVSALARAD